MPRTLSYSNASSSSVDLSSKANVSDVNALTTRVDTAETNINDLSALETIVTGSGDSDFTLTNVTQVTPNTSGVGFGGGADGEYPTGGGDRIFDNNVQSDYVILKQGTGDIPSPQNIFYLTYDHGADVIINRYRLFRHSSLSPQSWTFEASTDNSTFVTLDTTYQNSNLSNPSYSGNSPEDNVANANSADFNSSDTAYRYYRFGFTGANGGADELKVSELQFFRVQTTTRNMKNVLDDLETDLGSLSTTVDGKAEASTVSALSTTVSGKADQSALNSLSNTVTSKISLDVSDTEYAISKGQYNAYAIGDASGPSNPQVYDALSNLTDGNSATGCVAEMSQYTPYFDIILETDRDVIAKRVVLHPLSTMYWSFGPNSNFSTTYPPGAQFGYDDGMVTMLGSLSNVGTASSGHDITVSHTTARRRWVVRVWPRPVEDIDEYLNTDDRFFWSLSKIDFEYDHVPIVNDVVSYDGTRYVPRYPTVISARFTWGYTTYLHTSTSGGTTTLQFRINDFSGGIIQLASNYTNITMQPGTYLINFNYPYRRPHSGAMRAILAFKKNGSNEDKRLESDRYNNAASHGLGMDATIEAPYENLQLGGIVVVSSASDVYTLTIQTWVTSGATHLIPHTADTYNAGYIIKLA